MMSINLGVIGAGGFAHFATTEFLKIPEVKLIGILDENVFNAQRLQTLDGSAKIYDSIESICNDPSINLIYIATPPFLHHEQSKAALLAGKHVICEKPAAIKLSHAIELRELAEEKKLLFVVNLMQRYNPLYDSVTRLIQEKVLGDFLHGFFENYASDEALIETHWFWDEKKSGGIFIEHGVHFFDMFSGWLGEGKVVAAQKINRKSNPNIWDRFHATVLYKDGLVNFYHSFDQPKVMDRQEMRLQFERGEITLYEWVPTQLKMTALCDDENLASLREIFPSAKIDFVETYDQPHIAQGRFKEIKYKYKIKLDTGDSVQKQTLYQELVTKMFVDQLRWIRDKSHIRKVDQDNAVSSLKLAEEAESLSVRL
ncbi:MAG: Gfo/Idh/MocA family oxidoreductase [Cyclobacteriaceae bacterium]